MAHGALTGVSVQRFRQSFCEGSGSEFRSQVERRLSNQLSEDDSRPLRPMNGLYYQLHAYMLRVAIPYGLLSSRQMRVLGDVAARTAALGTDD